MAAKDVARRSGDKKTNKNNKRLAVKIKVKLQASRRHRRRPASGRREALKRDLPGEGESRPRTRIRTRTNGGGPNAPLESADRCQQMTPVASTSGAEWPPSGLVAALAGCSVSSNQSDTDELESAGQLALTNPKKQKQKPEQELEPEIEPRYRLRRRSAQLYEVAAIIAYRVTWRERLSSREFQVRWVGYEEPTWEPEETLAEDCPQALGEFCKNNI